MNQDSQHWSQFLSHTVSAWWIKQSYCHTLYALFGWLHASPCSIKDNIIQNFSLVIWVGSHRSILIQSFKLSFLHWYMRCGYIVMYGYYMQTLPYAIHLSVIRSALSSRSYSQQQDYFYWFMHHHTSSHLFCLHLPPHSYTFCCSLYWFPSIVNISIQSATPHKIQTFK